MSEMLWTSSVSFFVVKKAYFSPTFADMGSPPPPSIITKSRCFLRLPKRISKDDHPEGLDPLLAEDGFHQLVRGEELLVLGVLKHENFFRKP